MTTPINPRLPKLWHGGDYNPDQWPADTRKEDIRLMKLSHSNVMSVGIFAWAQLEPEPGRYDWSWLDGTMDQLHDAGVYVALATPSAAQPRWLSEEHPEVMAVSDSGQRYRHGGRVMYCPTSPAYRQHVERINRALAERYGDHPALVLWHVSNEYSTGFQAGKSSRCYCDLCVNAFRDWLRDRYGDIDTLNHQYWSAFWSQTYFDFDQVHPPSSICKGACVNGLSLDWRRFSSQRYADFFKHEATVLREITPDVPITTNLMGLYNGIDYRKSADIMDVISWDSYPDVTGDPGMVAFTHALMRGMKDNKPWILMESTPSSTNWKQYHSLKPPGMHRLWAWQAIGHGSDASMYFQWRRSRGAHEKFHGAVVSHEGSEKPRVFRELIELGSEMDALSDAVIGTRPARAKVGILWDQENRWALQLSAGPGKDKRIEQTAIKHFRAVWSTGVPVDVVRMDADWSQYDVLIAPMLYMVKSGEFPKNASPEELIGRLDEGEKLRDWVAGGGTLVTTHLSGIVNENDLVYEGGYPGPLRELLGIWSEEIDNWPEGERTNRMRITGLEGLESEYTCDVYFDLIHAEGADVLATYVDNWYAGRPCLTKNDFGDGQAWYVAADPQEEMLRDLYAMLCGQKGIGPAARGDTNVEILKREGEDRTLLFMLNHADQPRSADLGQQSGTDLLTGKPVEGKVELPAYGVAVVQLN